jgi:hypothetical protein
MQLLRNANCVRKLSVLASLHLYPSARLHIAENKYEINFKLHNIHIQLQIDLIISLNSNNILK